MQKIATRIFIISSLLFGLLGILMVIVEPDQDSSQTTFDRVLMKAFFVTIFFVLPSFALSVASKYLHEKSK